MSVKTELVKFLYEDRFKDIPSELRKKILDIVIYQISIYLTLKAIPFSGSKIKDLLKIKIWDSALHNHPFLLLSKILFVHSSLTVDEILKRSIEDNQYFDFIQKSEDEDISYKVFYSNPNSIRSVILSREDYNIDDEMALKLCEVYNLTIKTSFLKIYEYLLDNANFDYNVNIKGLNAIADKKPWYSSLFSTIITEKEWNIKGEKYLENPNTTQRANTDFSYGWEFWKFLSDLEDLFIIRYLQYQSLWLKHEFNSTDKYNIVTSMFLKKLSLGNLEGVSDSDLLENIADYFQDWFIDKKEPLNYKLKAILSITDFQKNKDIVDMHNRFTLWFFGLFLAKSTKNMFTIENFGDNLCLVDNIKPKPSDFKPVSFPKDIPYNMQLKPLAKEVIDYYNIKKIKSVLNLVKEKDCVGNIWRFFNEYRTSSDDFYYAIENGYIDYQLLTDTPFEKLTTSDLLLLRWYDETFFDFF